MHALGQRYNHVATAKAGVPPIEVVTEGKERRHQLKEADVRSCQNQQPTPTAKVCEDSRVEPCSANTAIGSIKKHNASGAATFGRSAIPQAAMRTHKNARFFHILESSFE